MHKTPFSNRTLNRFAETQYEPHRLVEGHLPPNTDSGTETVVKVPRAEAKQR